MKTFNIKMVDSGVDHVTVPFNGEGEVTFALKARTMEQIVNLRRDIAEQAGIGDGPMPSNSDALAIMFELAVKLVRSTLNIELTDDQAMLVVTNTGGIQGALVRELAIRFGVADILVPGDAGGGDDEELPM